MQNARLDESQAGIKIAGRNINNLRYADDTTIMAESKDELRSLYTDQEATVGTRHGTMNWFQIGKGIHQSCI